MGLYYLDYLPSGIPANISSPKCCVSKLTCHSRIGHPADQALNTLKDKLKLGNDSLPPCYVCHKAKQTGESFLLSQHNTIELGELIHLDVWGLIELLLLMILSISDY